MDWSELVLFNAVGATILAGVVAVVATRTKRSSVVHLLWLLVLVKLVSLPALEVNLLPRAMKIREAFQSGAATTVVVPEPIRTDTDSPAPERAPAGAVIGDPAAWSATASPFPSSLATNGAERLARLLGIVGLAGASILIGLTVVRTVRFRRLLRDVPDAPPALTARAKELAARLGLSRLPRIRLVPERIPPSLWPGSRGCEVLLPAPLLADLTPDERDALLAHELAHVRRRDHWIRPFELVIVALYWWHPVAWWARRNLRGAEEESCDALVMRALPDRPRAYAESLLKTVEFLSTRETPVPGLATGAGETSRLKERVTMILKGKTPAPLPAGIRPVLVAAALLAILVSPAWVDPRSAPAAQQGADAPPDVVEGERADAEYIQSMLEFRRQTLRLERELEELQVRRMQLEAQRDAAMQIREAKRMAEEIERLVQEGEKAEAEELRRELRMAEAAAAFDRERREFEQQHQEKQMNLQFELRELELLRDELIAHGKEADAEDIAERMRALEKSREELHLEVLQAEIKLSRELLAREAAELEEARAQP